MTGKGFSARLRSGLAALLCLLSSGTGAGEAKTVGMMKIPLKVINLPDPKATDVNSVIERAKLEAFHQQYPEIEVTAFSGISIPNIGNESQLMLAIAGGQAPDIINVNFRMSDTYIQQGFLHPLDDYIRNDPEYGSVRRFLETLPEIFVPIMYREGPAVGGFPAGKHVWMVGSDITVRVFFWRKDLFKQVGLDPEKPPRNWEEMLYCAKCITNPAANRYGINLSKGLQRSWDFIAFLWSSGVDIVEKDKDGRWRASFGTRAAAEALEFYMRLETERWIDSEGVMQHGYSTSTADPRSLRQALMAGKIGMYQAYLGDKNVGDAIDPALIGVTTFPAGPSGKGVSEINTRLDCIFAGIAGRRNSEGQYVPADKIRDAAWKYIRFMNSKTARGIYAKEMVDFGFGKILSPAYLREFGYTEYLKYYPRQWEETFNNAMKNGKPEPYGKNCQLVYLYLTQPMDEAMQLYRDGKLPEGNAPQAVERRIRIFEKLLKAAEERTNSRMIGYVSPGEKAKRLNVAMAAAVLLLALFCFVLYKIWQIFSPKDSFSGKKRGWEFRRCWGGYLIMLPAVLTILLWIYYPMITGSQIFFQDYRLIGESRWNGLENLAGVLFSNEWWHAIWTTFRYMLFMLTLAFAAPIILALLLQEVSCGKVVYRLIYYLPAVMSGMVVLFMWRQFYQAGSAGILNQVCANIAGLFGMKFVPQDWLNDSTWAMAACTLPTIWAGMGPGCLIYLAALKGVPDETYEAAEIDGANFFQKIRHVTLPTLKSLIIINFVGAFISASQSGGNMLVMTFGMADTEVAELHIFKEAYTMLNFGSAIAMAWMLGSLTLLFTIYNLKRLSQMEFKTTEK
ncbi:MAG: L-arabinose transport system permease protein AraP [Lentisphaerae bacterium ADurb.Bin242]|nr:MAG: L-arabinose transport system permease protein AraP [Lentisphaerae bacterium ADurb.Bin242]